MSIPAGPQAIADHTRSSETDGESAPTQAPVYQLSTFTPSRDNVVGESDAEWTIRLERNDVSVPCLRQIASKRKADHKFKGSMPNWSIRYLGA